MITFAIRLIEWIHDLRCDCSHFVSLWIFDYAITPLRYKIRSSLSWFSDGFTDPWIDAIMSHGERRHPRRKPSLVGVFSCCSDFWCELVKRKENLIIWLCHFQPAAPDLALETLFVVFCASLFSGKFLSVWIGFETENKHTRKRAEEKWTIQLIYDSVRGRRRVPKVEQRRVEIGGGVKRNLILWCSSSHVSRKLMENVFFNSEEESRRNFLMASIDINARSKLRIARETARSKCCQKTGNERFEASRIYLRNALKRN